MDDLEDIIETQVEALQMRDFSLYLAKEHEFHTSIAQYAANDLLYDFVDKINVHVQRFLTLSLTLQKSSLSAVNEHRAIVSALKLRKAAAAEEAMRVHVVHVAERMIPKMAAEEVTG